MNKVKPNTVVAEGYIKDADHYPATKNGKWKQTKDRSVYVQIGEGAAWRGVKVDDPQRLLLTKGFLCERKERTDGYQYEAPAVFKTGEVCIESYTDDVPKPSIKERFAELIRRKACTRLSD